MPYLDGTGPNGTGPYGRGMGPCWNGGRAVFGMGRCRGMGFWRGNLLYTELSQTELRKGMEAEVQALEGRLKYLKERLVEEEKGSP